MCSDVAPNLIHSSPNAGLDAVRDHRVQHAAARLVADAVPQLAARAHVLHRRQVAALVVHAGQAVARELLRDVRESVARALLDLRRRERRPRARPAERAPRARSVTRPLSSPFASRSNVPPVGIRRVLRDAGQLERLAVVERRVAAAMPHDDRMLLGHLVEVAQR